MTTTWYDQTARTIVAARVRLLGPVVVSRAGRVVHLSQLERALVSCLALHDRQVSVPSIVSWLWADPPTSARNRVQALVSGTRRQCGVRDLITTEAGGYRLGADVRVDLAAWTQLVAHAKQDAARGRNREAARRYRNALALWAGQPLDGLRSTHRLEHEAARLNEARLQVVESCLAAELAGGSGSELVVELQVLCAEHPFRERLHELLMWALAAAGRRSDALRVYRDAHRQLTTELGIQPGPGLQRAHARILSGALPRQASCGLTARTPRRRGCLTT